MPHKTLAACCLSWLTQGLLGCSAQVTPAYFGEPLATVHGVIVNGQSAIPQDAELALVWLMAPGEPSPVLHPVGTTVPVTTEFPSSFTLHVYEPPPPQTMENEEDASQEPVRFSVAFVFVLKKGAVDRLDQMLPGDVLGVSDDSFLAYFESGVPEGSAAARRFEGSYGSGYYLFTIDRSDEEALLAFDLCMNQEMEKHSELLMCEGDCWNALGAEASPDVIQPCLDQCALDHGVADVAECDPAQSIDAAKMGLDTEIIVRLVDDPRVEGLWPLLDPAYYDGFADTVAPPVPF